MPPYRFQSSSGPALHFLTASNGVHLVSSILMVPWRAIQRENFTKWQDLIDFLQLSPSNEEEPLFTKHFPLNVPLRLAQKMEKNRWDDPILLQFLPTPAETRKVSGFTADAVGDVEAQKTKKLLHKYQGRALLLTTGSCAMHCRFCFRQHYSYETEELGLAREIDWIARDSSLKEVILSGGDPLSLSDCSLQALIDALNSIPHLERIRFHTRFPIGIPERIDESFLRLLATCRKRIIFVIHTNHVRELDPDILSALGSIQRLGIPLLSQSVLLKGVNDTFSTLRELFETLVNHSILPYYLHQLDRTDGTSHFEVEETEGKRLMDELAASLPGYAVPKYVREEAGCRAKTLLGSR